MSTALLPGRKRRTYSPRKKATVCAYARAHGAAAATRRFAISHSMVSKWLRRPPPAARPAAVPTDAVLYLEAAQRALTTTPATALTQAELYAMMALRTLRPATGGKGAS